MHAFSKGQSELIMHSGLQVGGEPMKLAWQEHTACSLTTLHWLLGPQGDGLQGTTFGITGAKKKVRK